MEDFPGRAFDLHREPRLRCVMVEICKVAAIDLGCAESVVATHGFRYETNWTVVSCEQYRFAGIREGALGMSDFWGVVAFTALGFAGVVAYIVWSLLSSAFATRQQSEKERRWAQAFGVAPEKLPPLAYNPLRAVAWIGGSVVLIGVVVLVVIVGRDAAQSQIALDKMQAESDIRREKAEADYQRQLVIFENARAEAAKQRLAPSTSGGQSVAQRRELAWFGMRALGLLVDQAAVMDVPDEAGVRELVATGINLNGHLCAHVTTIRALKLDGAYEVECIEYRGGTTTKIYVIHASRGVAFVP